MADGPSLTQPAWRRVRTPLTAAAAMMIAGLVVQACGVASMGGMGGMGMMGEGMMGSDQRYADASAAPPVTAAPEIRVIAGDMYFEPSEVRIVAGMTVNLTLENEGAAFHDLTIPARDFILAADARTEATGSVALDEPGAYEFFCSVPGHAQAGMTGVLLVE